MPMYQKANGEWINVQEGTPPEVLRKLGVARTTIRQGAANRPPPNSERAEINRRVQRETRARGGGHGFANPLARGFGFNFTDELTGALAAGTFGVANAIRKGDIGEIGKEYRITKGVEEQLARNYSNENPILSPTLEIAGSLVNPIGTTGRTATAAAAAMKGRRGLTAGGRVIDAANSVIGRSPILRGITTGAKTAALNAAGIADVKDYAEALPAAATVGAATGGLMGGAAALGGKALDTFARARAKNADDVALERVAELLQGAKIKPDKAERELAVTAARGGVDPMLMDLSPGLRAEAAAISRRHTVPASNEIIERAGQRIDNRRVQFAEQALADADLPQNMPPEMKFGGATQRAEDIANARRAQGQADYAQGGSMDLPIKRSPELREFMEEQPEITRRAFKEAYDLMGNFRDDIGLRKLFDGDTITYFPNMRTFDYAKRGYDNIIGQAMQSGNRTLAKAGSEELARLKEVIIKSNPEYKTILRAQRDLFQQQRATELGQKFWKDVTSARGSRQHLNEVKKMSKAEFEDWRIGTLDVLANMDDKANPVGMFHNAMRSPVQRALLEKVFGGTKELNRFARWIRRENRALEADKLTAAGRGSETSRIQAAAQDQDGGASYSFWNMLKGYYFGGLGGAAGNLATSVRNIWAGTPLNKASQEAIAKLLMSRGEGLSGKIGEASKRVEQRAARRSRAIQRASRITSYNASDTMFGGE